MAPTWSIYLLRFETCLTHLLMVYDGEFGNTYRDGRMSVLKAETRRIQAWNEVPCFPGWLLLTEDFFFLFFFSII